MYKLFIADDEKVVIDGLLSVIDWHEHQIEVVGTAMDGSSAYQLIEETEPDIVIADIRMPGLNGLELIHKAKSVYPDTAFIIISGYTQFDYAKRAIELEAVDYLTKPIELDGIIEAVKRAIQKYEKLKERKETNIKLEHYQTQVEEKYVLHSLFGNHIDHLEFMGEFNGCTVFVTDCKSKNHSTDKLLELLKSENNEAKKSRYFSYVIEDHLVTICFLNGIDEQNNDFLKKLKLLYKELLVYPITGISSTHKDITTIQPLYKEAMEAYHVGLYLQQEVTQYKDLESMNNIVGPIILNKIDEFFLGRKIDFSSINKLIDDMFDFSIREKLTPTKSKFLCFKLINHIFEYLHEEFDMNVEKVLKEEKYLIYANLNQLITMDEHKIWLMEKIDKLFGYLFENQMSQKQKLMYDVKNYVKETYNQTIGLDEIAERFHISPAYLSSLFSKNTGVTLFEYIINMRMEKAKELLRTTNNKISDICQHVGYENQRYFNQVFKKHIGTTPGAYRSNHLVK